MQTPRPDRGEEPRFLLWRAQGAEERINLDFRDRHVTALIGPSGCGKSTLLRIFNRIYSLYPEQRATGEVMLDGRNVISNEVDRQRAALAHRHGLPEADAVPDVDLRQHRLRHPPL
jgi:ABC-type phosphate transport system ATPase subunit